MNAPEFPPRSSVHSTRLTLPRFQFSLWWLMVLVTVVAISLGASALLGGLIAWLLFEAVVMCAVPTPLIIGAVFGRGDLRAFAIGGLVPWLLLWADSPAISTGNWFAGRALLLGIFVMVTSVACGIVAVVSRRWIERLG